MRYLFYSDLHLRPERITTCDFVLGEIGQIAKKYNAIIVNGGDTFNTRGLIKTSCFDLLYRHYTRWFDLGLRQIINIGNHDQEDLAGEIHPMKVFENFDGWTVTDKPVFIDDMSFFPYMSHKAIKQALEEQPSMFPSGRDAVVHWGIKGAKRNDWNVDTDGVPLEWLKVFKNVFAGHYHYRSELENVQYIGSPFQQSFAEINQDKGVILYDTKTKKKEFIEITGTPKHYKLSYDANKSRFETDTKKSISTCDFVEVAVTGDADKVQVVTVDTIRKHIKCDNIRLDRQAKERAFSRLKIDSTEVFDSKGLMKKYIDFVETDLDRDKLMRIGEELV